MWQVGNYDRMYCRCAIDSDLLRVVSKKGTSFFITTCGITAPSKNLYRSNFEDEYGGVTFKDIQRPEIAEFLYQYLPLIDEHNKQRQKLLNLERCWPTKCCWSRLHITLLGMAVTDLYHLYHYYDINHCYEYNDEDLEDMEDLENAFSGYINNEDE